MVRCLLTMSEDGSALEWVPWNSMGGGGSGGGGGRVALVDITALSSGREGGLPSTAPRGASAALRGNQRDSGAAVRCGFLDKLGEGVMKTWSRRYFVLVGTHLDYMRDAADEAVTGTLELAGGGRAMPAPRRGEWAFEVCSPGGGGGGGETRRGLRAESEDDMAGWVRAVNEAGKAPLDAADDAALSVRFGAAGSLDVLLHPSDVPGAYGGLLAAVAAASAGAAAARRGGGAAAAADAGVAVYERAEAAAGGGSGAAALIAYGTVLSRLGRRDAGVGVLRRAVAVAPGDSTARGALARALSAAGDLDGALREAEAGVWLAPEDAAALCLCGGLQARRGDPAGAVKRFRRAAAVDARCREAHAGLAASLGTLGRCEEAAAHTAAAQTIDDATKFQCVSRGIGFEKLVRPARARLGVDVHVFDVVVVVIVARRRWWWRWWWWGGGAGEGRGRQRWGVLCVFVRATVAPPTHAGRVRFGPRLLRGGAARGRWLRVGAQVPRRGAHVAGSGAALVAPSCL